MLPEEIKQLLDLSKGKIVLSEGDVKDSYVVMKLVQYLEEFGLHSNGKKDDNYKNEIENLGLKQGRKFQTLEEITDLTDIELLDKINSDIEVLRQRKMEQEIENILDEAPDEFDYDYYQ